MVPYQLALRIQLHSACLCQSWGGAEEAILPLSLAPAKPGSQVFLPGKMLSDSAELLPFSQDLSTLWHIGQTPETPAEQHFTQSSQGRS